MAMKYLRKYYVDRDQYGTAQTGSTVEAFPTGTSSNGTTATPDGYQYKFTIDPTSNPSKICSHYDIKINSILVKEHIPLGEWKWFVELSMNSADKTFQFQNLNDENGVGHPLPTSIPNAIVQIISTSRGRQAYVASQNDSQVNIKLQDAGDDDCKDSVLSGNPLIVKALVTIKETF